MYGHIDQPQHWAAHLGLLRDIQKETGGFTELVPLGFVHHDSPLYARRDDVRPGPTEDENLKMHAVARVMLHGWIDNIQVSWVKLGHEMAVKMLQCGANDLGGTLMNESISRASGAKYGQEVTPKEMVDLIRAAGQVPFRRNTLYDVLETFDDHDPLEIAPLVTRDGGAPLDFLKVFLGLHIGHLGRMIFRYPNRWLIWTECRNERSAYADDGTLYRWPMAARHGRRHHRHH